MYEVGVDVFEEAISCNGHYSALRECYEDILIVSCFNHSQTDSKRVSMLFKEVTNCSLLSNAS